MEAFLKKHLEDKKTDEDLGKRVINFGKHKGKTYKELFETEKSYVAFILSKFDKEKNKKLFKYLEYMIENETEG